MAAPYREPGAVPINECLPSSPSCDPYIYYYIPSNRQLAPCLADASPTPHPCLPNSGAATERRSERIKFKQGNARRNTQEISCRRNIGENLVQTTQLINKPKASMQ